MFTYNLRILLVEDHPFQLTAALCLLNSYGFTQVTTANTAANALQKMNLAHPPFELLLCDQCLPDFPGLDLISIASLRGLIQQAILLSSLDCQELNTLKKAADEHRLPLLGYLAKPLQKTELINLLMPDPGNS